MIIGADGRVKNAQLVYGHPLLVESARDAVMQYVYRAADSEIATQIDVNFLFGH